MEIQKQRIGLKGYVTKFLRTGSEEKCVFLFQDEQYGKLVCHTFGNKDFTLETGKVYNLQALLKGFKYTKTDGREFVNNGLLVLDAQVEGEESA
jgi:hypothetical protein